MCKGVAFITKSFYLIIRTIFGGVKENKKQLGGVIVSEQTLIPFEGTKEQEQELKAVIEELKDEKGCLMPIMQKAQGIYGYLPVEVQQMISDGLAIPLEKIYGVATFYSQFNLQPKGEYQISVCLGTACYVKGSGNILEEVSEILGIKTGECTPDRKFSLDACRCVGACGLAPVMMINDEVYGRLEKKDVKGILEKYK
ncbi:NADP-reducing hydrogenase subunit HndA [Eubacterium oxidoreducens]|uniref:NADP-reducing hydrogenase subunit HndA n=1 Tax=Eubacterium oxidoreducens TaxID=1732 RepID=A0A1G6BVI2_EUBOX|nr:NADP-reducing hydrogenase subunit HndA [Eubacterium oxidoreducens]